MHFSEEKSVLPFGSHRPNDAARGFEFCMAAIQCSMSLHRPGRPAVFPVAPANGWICWHPKWMYRHGNPNGAQPPKEAPTSICTRDAYFNTNTQTVIFPFLKLISRTKQPPKEKPKRKNTGALFLAERKRRRRRTKLTFEKGGGGREGGEAS